MTNYQKYALVHCFVCGDQYLTQDQYDEQLNKPNDYWRCPNCGAEARFDDDYYERNMEQRIRDDEYD